VNDAATTRPTGDAPARRRDATRRATTGDARAPSFIAVDRARGDVGDARVVPDVDARDDGASERGTDDGGTMTVASSSSTRGDGRASDMLRRQRVHRWCLGARARGSAEYAIDGTVVVAAVHGPQAVAPWREDHARGVIDFELTSGGGGRMTRDEARAFEARVRGAIEATVVRHDFPRMGLRVCATVASDDGNAEAACVNAVCCALVDADVPMYGMLCANSCAIMRDGRKVIDPTAREEREARGVVRACALSKTREKEEIAIVGCSTTGCMTEEEYLDSIAFIIDANASVLKFQKKSIARYELEGKLREDAPTETKRAKREEDVPMEGLENKPVG